MAVAIRTPAGLTCFHGMAWFRPGASVSYVLRVYDEQGRYDETRPRQARLIQASKGRRQLVFVGGEPGIGKTTLVELFVNRLTGRPRTTCFLGQCAMSSGRSSTAC